MYLDRSKMLSFFFFSLSCRGSRAHEVGSAAGSRRAPPAPRAPPCAHRHLAAPHLSTPRRGPPPCSLTPLRTQAWHGHGACAARHAGALLGNIWRRLRPANMAAALAWLAAACLLFAAQVRAVPAPSIPQDAVTRPLDPQQHAGSRPARPGDILGDPRPPRGRLAGCGAPL